MTIRDKDKGQKRIFKQLKKANKLYTLVGFNVGKVTPLNVKKAIWNEFGTKPKNRKSGIPSRPFMRTTFKKYINRVLKFEQKLFKQIEKGTLTTVTGLKQLGAFYVGLIQITIRTGNWTPNAPSTQQAKESSKPLIDEKEMLNAVTHIETKGIF